VIVYSNGAHDPPRSFNPLRAWLEAKLGDNVCKDAQFIGRLDDKENVVASCAFSSYTGEGNDIELSFACDPNGGTPALVAAIFGYAFGQLKCARVTARVRKDNHASRRLVKRLGFKLEGCMRKAERGKDKLIFGLLREEYGEFSKASQGSRSKHDHQRGGIGESCQPDHAVRQPDIRPERIDDDASSGNAERL
jgi:RimJ/RimL family protein N-acetyltransferase